MWETIKRWFLAVIRWWQTKECDNIKCQKRMLKSALTKVGFSPFRVWLCGPCLIEYEEDCRRLDEEGKQARYESLVKSELELLKAKEEARMRFAALKGMPYRTTPIRVTAEEEFCYERNGSNGDDNYIDHS